MTSSRIAQRKLVLIICLTAAFTVAEIAVGLRTRSLALIADAFHYLFDFGSYTIAFMANRLAAKTDSPERLTYGWARARVLGSFVNGITLAALGFSIFVQSLQRFIVMERVKEPMLMLSVGCVGLGLNVISLAFFHDHGEACHPVARSKPQRQMVCSELEADANHGAESSQEAGDDKSTAAAVSHDHGFAALFLHALGDAAANLGVIAAAIIIWKTKTPGRFYADPALSLAISILIMVISVPLIRETGLLLAESAPDVLKQEDLISMVKEVSGVVAVHKMKIWRLNEERTIASAHIVLLEHVHWPHVRDDIKSCFYNHGIDAVTIETCGGNDQEHASRHHPDRRSEATSVHAAMGLTDDQMHDCDTPHL